MKKKQQELTSSGLLQDKNAATKKSGCCRCHMNSLGSLCYCVLGLGLTAFIITTEVQQLFKYLVLPWPDGRLPEFELNIFIGLIGGATALVPFFFCTAIFKVGNFANDGFRLGVHDSGCSKDPPPLPLPAGGLLRGAWRNGGPTAPFIHLIISQAVILARLIMEGAVIRHGFLPKETVWSSELSLLLPQEDRISIIKRLERYSNNIDHSHSVSHPGGSEVSPTLVFSTSSTGMEKHVMNQSFPVLTPTNGGDVWHVGEIPWGPFTPHLINYLLAHLVYSGRYAAVFWGTNKSLGLFFFFQLLLNTAQSILTLNGFQVLYKVQMLSLFQRVLPVEGGFLIPLLASIGLYLALQTLVLASGSVIYLYGYVKFQSFLNQEREKYHILTKHGHQAMWPYWPHFWSLVVLVLLTGAASPLIYDWTVIYRSSLDSASLVATCGTVLYLFLWILLWMALTIKTRWQFKLRVQISKTIVSNTHSIRLVNDVHLSQQAEQSEGPVMVIGSGKTYLLQEEASKRALMRLVLTTLTEKKARGEEEEIYWLRPKAPLDQPTSWSKKRASPGVKHKVTFNENTDQDSLRLSDKSGKNANERDTPESSVESDGGDYARLSAVSFPGPVSDTQGSSANTLGIPTSEDALSVGADFPAPPPELTNPAHYPPPPDSPPPPLPSGRVSTYKSSGTTAVTLSPHKIRVKNPIINVVRGGDSTEANGYLRDSGLMADCPDSSSTTSSVTPPDKRSDSGVHSGTHSKSGSSGSERDIPPPMPTNNLKMVSYAENLPPPPAPSMARCSSVDELCSLPPAPNTHSSARKTYSLQHGSRPPQANEQSYHQAPVNTSQSYHQQSPNNNNTNYKQNNNERSNPENPFQPQVPHDSSGKKKLSIKVLGGGYGFLPPSKFVASEPIYSDASTPVAIKRRSSISAVEPETPPYERSAASFSTFTEPQLPRAILKGSAGLQQALAAAIPGKAMTVSGHMNRNRHQVYLDAKHATIAGSALPKGFHQPSHIDSRYFSVPAVKHQV